MKEKGQHEQKKHSIRFTQHFLLIQLSHDWIPTRESSNSDWTPCGQYDMHIKKELSRSGGGRPGRYFTS